MGISEEAIEHSLAMHGFEVPEDLHEAFSAVALDNGYVTYKWFLAATMPRSLRCRQDLCRRAFTLLDQNRDGVIDIDDLESVFLSKDEQDSHTYKTLIRNALEEAALRESSDALSADPKLDFEAFSRLVLAGSQVIDTPKGSM